MASRVKKLIAVSGRALRDGNKVIEELLPEDALEDYLKRSSGRIARNRVKASVPAWDEEIVPEKWYPGTFGWKDEFIIAPQGWWHRSIAIKWWKHRLGKTAINRDIFFIRGSEVIEKGYTIRKQYYYHGKRNYLSGKILFPLEVRMSKSRKSFKKTLKRTAGCDGSTPETEPIFYTTLFRTLPKLNSPYICKKTIRQHKYQLNKIKRNGSKNTRN